MVILDLKLANQLQVFPERWKAKRVGWTFVVASHTICNGFLVCIFDSPWPLNDEAALETHKISAVKVRSQNSECGHPLFLDVPA